MRKSTLENLDISKLNYATHDDSPEIKEKLAKIKDDNRFFDRHFCGEIDYMVSHFAWCRFHMFGACAEPETFRLVSDVSYYFPSGEVLNGYLPEGAFCLNNARFEPEVRYVIVAEVIESEPVGECGGEIYYNTVFKLYRDGKNITGLPEATPVLAQFSTLYEEVASACLGFENDLEALYKGWVVDFAAKENIGMGKVNETLRVMPQ